MTKSLGPWFYFQIGEALMHSSLLFTFIAYLIKITDINLFHGGYYENKIRQSF